jgi:hypothetical protein
MWAPAIITLALAFAAWGGATTTTTPRPEAIPSPPRPWDELSHEEKGRWMAHEVLPRMSVLFEEYDAQRFADVDCTTCHGDDAAARSFAMPNPGIVALYPTGSVGQQQTVRDYPEGVRFMYNRVVPTMRTLLGEAEFDAATGQGFTCYACHPHGEDPALAAPAPQ